MEQDPEEKSGKEAEERIRSALAQNKQLLLQIKSSEREQEDVAEEAPAEGQ